jgi:O-Antigen ligase
MSGMLASVFEEARPRRLAVRLRLRTVLGLGALGLTLGLASANGGFFPTSWGWAMLPAFWATAVALLVRERIVLRRLELVFLGAVVAYAGWTWLSLLWTGSVTETVPEGERALVLVAAVAAVLTLAERRSTRSLLGGVLAAIVAASAYGLGTRLFPERLGSLDQLAAYRLAAPIGYWNGLGIFCALGILLAFGFALRGRATVARAGAAASLLVLVPTLYFTFSRGAMIALAIGLLAAFALDPRRLQLAAGSIALAVPPALAVGLASRDRALTRRFSAQLAASHQGHRLAAELFVLALLEAGLVLAFARAEQRILVGRGTRRAFAAGLGGATVATLIAVFAIWGSPPTLARTVYHDFSAPPPKRVADLNRHLFSLSGTWRIDLWRVALKDVAAHPLLGSGAGTYDRSWLRHRPTARLSVLDAHSLYLETLAELGSVGLALLLTLLAIPLVAAVRARRHPLVPLAFGAYVAFLVHAGVDWDWELAGVSVAALLCGVACLIAARAVRGGEGATLGWRPRLAATVALVGLSGFALVVLVGNMALSSSQVAAASGNWQRAEAKARTAIRWMPWSSDGWQQLGEAQLAAHQRAPAERSLRKAIALDPGNWNLWFDLARASSGRARRAALGRARSLDPREPELHSPIGRA